MNAQISPKAQIVAVLFHQFDKTTLKLVAPSGSSANKPYFYLDPFGLEVSRLAGVHNGEEFGIVRVVRQIPISDKIAAEKVYKPLLFVIDYDEELVTECMRRISTIRDESREVEVQATIDKILGINSDGTPSMHRRRALGLPMPSNQTKQEQANDFGDNLN